MAYAAVISLKHTTKRLKNTINLPQITKSAYDKELNLLSSMLKKLDASSCRSIDRTVINELDAEIREIVCKLEDVLESCQPSPSLPQKGMEQEIDSFLKKVTKLREKYNKELLQKPLPLENDAAAAAPPILKPTTVGFVDLSEQIRKKILGWQYELRTVSLVGMAGIGKTHLATNIYQHPLTVQHFDSRIWVSVGTKDQIKNFSLDLVAQIEGKHRNLFKGKSEATLRGLIRNNLRFRRYLIVLDDIWGTQVLDYFTELLPNYENKSRILLTTRLREVAQHFWKNEVHLVPFLDKEESWTLLWQNVFADQDSFTSEFEKAGRKIAENCEGLPLLILTVANILSGLEKTEEYWKKVAEKKTTTFTDAYDQIYEVLLPSFEYLPQHLKACFLYMGVFPQSSEIPFSKLCYFWSVEDFLEPSLFQTLEEFAMDCVEGLISKSIVIVCKRRIEKFRIIKSFKLHSAYWYLCVKEARKNKFLHVLKKLTDVSNDNIERQRRLSVQNNILLGLKDVHDSMAAATSTTRSLLCTGEDHQYPVHICLNMMLLKVLDALAINFYEFPEAVLKLLKLKYLALTHNGKLPCSISKLQQLHCLILRRHHDIKLLRGPINCLPGEIWDMQELRHVRIMGSNLPSPSKGAMLPKLSTLYVNAASVSEDIFRSIPNLKKLGIKIELLPEGGVKTLRCLEHIKLLGKLVSLKCVVVNPRHIFAPPDHISHSSWRTLRKLSLNGLGYPWKYMTEIGSLYFLKVLKLRCCAFQGPNWETEAFEQFQSLEFLLLEDMDLVHWTIQECKTRRSDHKIFKCFPLLSVLIIRHCYKLKKIPFEFGDNPYLEMLEVDDCGPSVVDSAHQIKNKTRTSDLQLVINSSWNL